MKGFFVREQQTAEGMPIFPNVNRREGLFDWQKG